MDQKQQNQHYEDLMVEAKARLHYIRDALTGNTGLPAPLVREFCYLQLRMLCELIALACLVAHGDVTFPQPKSLTRNTSADHILKRLADLRPHFYPIAIVPTTSPMPDGRRLHEMKMQPSPLPKEDLMKLYAATHQHLHRGSLNKLLSPDRPTETTVSAPEIVSWANRIQNLLFGHMIFCSKDWGLLCHLQDQDGQVFVGNITTTPPN